MHSVRKQSVFTCRGKFMFNPATSFDNWDTEERRSVTRVNIKCTREVACGLF